MKESWPKIEHTAFSLEVFRKKLGSTDGRERTPPKYKTYPTPPRDSDRRMMARFLALTATEGGLMKWNMEPVPFLVALQIGWNLPMDVVGAGVYGGIVKRDSNGKIIIGDEWPEDNRAPPAHNPVHSTGPYLDFSKLTQESRGYTKIATVIMAGKVAKLEALLEGAGGEQERRKLANLVMSGGARPLHMCGMSRGGDSTELIRTLIKVRLHAACRPSLASPMPARVCSLAPPGRPPSPRAPAVRRRRERKG